MSTIEISEKSNILTKELGDNGVIYIVINDKSSDVFGIIGKDYNHSLLKSLGLSIYKGKFLRNSEGLSYPNRYVTMAIESLESRLEKFSK